MFGIFLVIFFALLLIIIVYSVQEPEDQNPILAVLLSGYFLRLVIRMFNRDLVVFSSGQTLGGADAVIYERRASMITQFWNYTGVHFITTQEIPEMRQVPLPPNLFAFVEYLNGGYTAIGNVSIISFLACMSALILYRCYVKYDPGRQISFWFMCFIFLSLSFLAMTSDSFKDGILIFLVVSIFAILVHVNRNNFYQLFPLLVLCFWCLDGTRHYLIYALLVPVLIRCFGFQSQKIFSFGTASTIGIICLLVGMNLSFTYAYLGNAIDVFEGSYSYGSQINTMTGGSGVDIDGGRPTLESLPIKMMYTLFAPFPWQSGSLGLHISKIEMLFWYYVLYWVYRGARIFLERDPMLAFMFLSFLIGMTIAYAWSFTNIGLIYRQRLPLLFVASIIAVWGKVAAKQKA